MDMEREMNMQPATKSDLDALRMAIRADIHSLKLSMRPDSRSWSDSADACRREFLLQCELLLASMTIRFGLMLIVGLSLFFAAVKLTGP
jgi:hypothetical protein